MPRPEGPGWWSTTEYDIDPEMRDEVLQTISSNEWNVSTGQQAIFIEPETHDPIRPSIAAPFERQQSGP